MIYIFYALLISLLLTFYDTNSSEVQDSALFYKDVRIVVTPVATVYCEPNENSLYKTHKLHGHHVEITQEINQEWVHVQIDDKTSGYMKAKELIQKNICQATGKIFSDDLLWRAHTHLMRIKDKVVLVYPNPNVNNQPLTRLFCNSYVKNSTGSDEKTIHNTFAQIELADGLKGWIFSESLEPIKPLDIKEIINRMSKPTGAPYLFEGISTNEYDSSGLTQFIAQLVGYYTYHNPKLQAEDDTCTTKIPYEQLTEGDLLYFGKNGNITHAGLFIGNDTILHAATLPALNEKKESLYKCVITNTKINNQMLSSLVCTRRFRPLTYYGTIEKINNKTFDYINGVSWNDNNPVPLDCLRLVTLSYWGFDRCVHKGSMIVHKEVAQEIVSIFKELFDIQYPIEKIKLIEKYNGNDGLACGDNNSFAFCSRQFIGGSLWSLHSLGLAVDINTRLNPFVYFNFDQKGNDFIGPVQGKDFVYNRESLMCNGLIIKNDDCYNIFKKYGWKWAGEWKEALGYPYNDYQHFYKDTDLSQELTLLAQANEPNPAAILPIYSQNSSYL